VRGLGLCLVVGIFVNLNGVFNLCRFHVNLDLAWDSDVIILDTPHGDLIEISSSSFGLLLFCLKAGSHGDEGAGTTPRESSSVSLGDLCLEIDSLREADREDVSVTATCSGLEASILHPRPGARGLRRERLEGVRDVGKISLLDEARRPSSAPRKSYGGGLTKKKVVLILLDTPLKIFHLA
jgi:hypothetical protein